MKQFRDPGDGTRSDRADGTSSDTAPPRATFEELYHSHYESIHKYFIRRGLDANSDAADLAADVYLTVWRRLDRVPPPLGERAWIFGIARNVLARHHRSTSRRKRLFQRIAIAIPIGIPTDSDSDDRLYVVRSEISKLSRREQETVKLVLWDELSHAEAAQVLGCSESAVAVRMHRVRNKLKDKLRHDFPNLVAETDFPAPSLYRPVDSSAILSRSRSLHKEETNNE
jgi:RNA polymerase sigma factor (sigma-70 family)